MFLFHLPMTFENPRGFIMSSCLRLGASRWRIFELLHHFTSLRWILVKQKRGENTFGGGSCWKLLAFLQSVFFFKSRVGRALAVNCMECIMVSLSKPWICLGLGSHGMKITIFHHHLENYMFGSLFSIRHRGESSRESKSWVGWAPKWHQMAYQSDLSTVQTDEFCPRNDAKLPILKG